MTLSDVREANEAGAGVAVLDRSLDLVLWANAAGGRLLGLSPASWQAEPAVLSASLPVSRQIKAAARIVGERGAARLLLRSGTGLAAKPVVADLKLLEEAGAFHVFLAVEAQRPASTDAAALAARLIEESGLAEAAVYGADGSLASSTASVDMAPTPESIAAFIDSGKPQSTMDEPGRRTRFSRVASRLVLVTHEAREQEEEAAEADAGDEPVVNADNDADAAGTPPKAGLFSVRRRRLPTGRAPMSMNALVQRWHHRNDAAPAETSSIPTEGTPSDAEAAAPAPPAAPASLGDAIAAPKAFDAAAGENQAQVGPSIDGAAGGSEIAFDEAEAFEPASAPSEAAAHEPNADDATAESRAEKSPREDISSTDDLPAAERPSSPDAALTPHEAEPQVPPTIATEPKRPLRSLWGAPAASAAAAAATATGTTTDEALETADASAIDGTAPEELMASCAAASEPSGAGVFDDSGAAASDETVSEAPGIDHGAPRDDMATVTAAPLPDATAAADTAVAPIEFRASEAQGDPADADDALPPTPSEDAFVADTETAQPQEKEAAVVLPDLPPEDAEALETPLSPDFEVPDDGTTTPAPSDLPPPEAALSGSEASDDRQVLPSKNAAEENIGPDAAPQDQAAAVSDPDTAVVTEDTVAPAPWSNEGGSNEDVHDAVEVSPDLHDVDAASRTALHDDVADPATAQTFDASLEAPSLTAPGSFDDVAPVAGQPLADDDVASPSDKLDDGEASFAEADDRALDHEAAMSAAADGNAVEAELPDPTEHPGAEAAVEALPDGVAEEALVGQAETAAADTEDTSPAAALLSQPLEEGLEDVAHEEADVEAASDASTNRSDEALDDALPAENVVPAFVPRFDLAPVRFVWQTDREGRFSTLSADFASTIGGRAADVIGRSFKDVAQVFGFDGEGEIGRLLDRRDTWSGRTILWPVESSDRKVPVDLAALPVYAADRSFDGFRGFGVLRMSDWVEDPDAVGLLLSDVPVAGAAAEDEPRGDEAAEASAPTDNAVNDAASTADAPAVPGAGDRPLLRTFAGDFPASSFGRRLEPPRAPISSSDAPEADKGAFEDATDDVLKVVRLEERRRPRDGALSQAEEAAFRAIGMKLGTASEAESPGALRFADAPPTDGDTKTALPNGDGSGNSDAAAKVADASPSADDAGRQASGPSAVVDAPAVPVPEPLAEDVLGSVGEAAVPATDSHPSSEDGHDAAKVIEASADHVPLAAGDVATSSGEPADEAPAKIHDAELDTAPDAPEDESLAGPSPADLEAVFGSLPLPILVQAQQSLIYANREFARFAGYEDLSTLRDMGGLDRLFAEAADGWDQGTVAIRRGDGELLRVRVHMQRVTLSARSCLLMSFTPPAAEMPETTGGQAPGPDGDPPSLAAPLVSEAGPEAGGSVIEPSRTGAPGDGEAADLHHQIEELQAVLDTATDGIVLLDPAGNIRSMNGSAHALFGIAQNDHQGRHLSSLFAHESQKATHDYLDTLRDDGLAGILNDGREVIGRVAQGGFIPLFITVGRLSGERGWCVVIRDIAHWKRIEEDLVNARRQAEAASLHKSRFLANISHELRTPLNAIIGFADVMASECFGPIGNERYLEYLGDIKRSGHHVLDLVNDLLDISKIEAGKLDLSFEAVSLNEVVSEVVSLMQPQANRERVIVRSNLPSSVPPVVADRRTIRQIALNLVANAIRFTPAGGQIIVSTTYTAEGAVVLRFRDSGIGMTEREIEIALTPFQQVHSPSVNRGEGTGLGLPLTKAMVEANRAAFAINSTPGEGTLIEIAFPSQRVLAD